MHQKINKALQGWNSFCIIALNQIDWLGLFLKINFAAMIKRKVFCPSLYPLSLHNRLSLGDISHILDSWLVGCIAVTSPSEGASSIYYWAIAEKCYLAARVVVELSDVTHQLMTSEDQFIQATCPFFVRWCLHLVGFFHELVSSIIGQNEVRTKNTSPMLSFQRSAPRDLIWT